MSHEGGPDFKSPPAGCDCHFHVFGPAGLYPYNQADLRYAPPVAPVEDFLTLAKKLGIERFVFVQPSAYGRDNRCVLDAMRMIGTKNCRGIVDIDENAPDAELERLNAAGVRGVRINVPPVKPYESGFAAKLLPRIERLAGRCAEIGWQLDFLTPGWLTAELMPTLRKLDVDFTIAHFGMFFAKDGVKQPGFQHLLELLLAHWRDREPRLLQERHAGEDFVRLDVIKADGFLQGFDRDKVHAGPIAFLRRHVRVSLLLHLREADDLFLSDAVVERHEIALLHGAKIISRLKIADAGPGCSAVREEHCPRVGFGLRFHEPVILCHAAKSC